MRYSLLWSTRPRLKSGSCKAFAGTFSAMRTEGFVSVVRVLVSHTCPAPFEGLLIMTQISRLSPTCIYPKLFPVVPSEYPYLDMVLSFGKERDFGLISMQFRKSPALQKRNYFLLCISGRKDHHCRKLHFGKLACQALRFCTRRRYASAQRRWTSTPIVSRFHRLERELRE